MREPYVLNQRFLIDPQKNTVKDLSSGDESRIEQRLMKVLTMLVANPGKLVSREHIVREIWNDYGGADEAVTQAVSFLRKILHDKDKKIIETIPKKGYVLNASIDP